MKKILFILPFLFLLNIAKGQILIPIDKMIKVSTYIFEGKPLYATCFENPKNHEVYTSAIYKVNKIFKGDLQCGNVEIVSMGGQIGHKITDVSDLPSMSDSGIIMAFAPTGMPSLRHIKENPMVLETDEMIEYLPNGQKTDYSYYYGQPFANKKAVYDTITRILGYGYMSCEHYPKPEPCPGNEAIRNVNNENDSNAKIQKQAPQTINNISVYPNPADSIIEIMAPDYINNILLFLYDTNGRLILKKYMTKESLHNFDISSLKSGFYSGTMNISGRVYNFNFIKE